MAQPLVKSTNELVHKFLLMGKNGWSSRPATSSATPAAARPSVLRAASRFDLNHSPARIPTNKEAIAGNVERNPSGSHVLDSSHKCPPINERSMYAPRLSFLPRCPAP